MPEALVLVRDLANGFLKSVGFSHSADGIRRENRRSERGPSRTETRPHPLDPLWSPCPEIFPDKKI
jgi:hypothetical protein